MGTHEEAVAALTNLESYVSIFVFFFFFFFVTCICELRQLSRLFTSIAHFQFGPHIELKNPFEVLTILN